MKTCAGNGLEDGDTSIEEVISSERNKWSNKREYLTFEMVSCLTWPHHLDKVDHYRVKQTTQLGKVKKYFSERNGVPLSSLRFLYHGRRINDEDTPDSLEMESGDSIDVFNGLGVDEDEMDIGIGRSMKLKLSPDLLDESREEEDRDSTREEVDRDSTREEEDRDLANVENRYRVKKTTQLGKVKKCFSERNGVSLSSLRFLYHGKRIADDDTPDSLEMESGDEIEVFNEQGGTKDDMDIDIGRSKKLKLSPDLLDESREKEDRDSTREEEDRDAIREELGRITRKYEDLVDKLRDKVECPVCFEIPKKAPVPVCPNGHVVCARCVSRRCPTCRVNMGQGISTLAVTVIENIEHQCDNEGCDLTFALSDLPSHMSQCRHRIVRCPGLDCLAKLPMSKLHNHVVTCCLEGAEIKPHKLPQMFTYMMKEDISDIKGRKQDFNWILEGLKFDEKLFFLKVTRKQRTGEWFFFVQMIGSLEDTSVYGVTIEVFRLEDGLKGKYSQRYSGDICPIDIRTVNHAYDRGLCLTLQDGGMAKLLVKDTNSGNNKCSVLVDIFRA